METDSLSKTQLIVKTKYLLCCQLREVKKRSCQDQ